MRECVCVCEIKKSDNRKVTERQGRSEIEKRVGNRKCVCERERERESERDRHQDR